MTILKEIKSIAKSNKHHWDDIDHAMHFIDTISDVVVDSDTVTIKADGITVDVFYKGYWSKVDKERELSEKDIIVEPRFWKSATRSEFGYMCDYLVISALVFPKILDIESDEYHQIFNVINFDDEYEWSLTNPKIDKAIVLWVDSVLFTHSNLPVGEEIDSDALDKQFCIKQAAKLCDKITEDDESEESGNVYWRTGITYGHEAQWEVVVKIEEYGHVHPKTEWYYEGKQVI